MRDEIVVHIAPCPLAEPPLHDELRGELPWDNQEVDSCACPLGYPRRECVLCGREGGRHAAECDARREQP